MNPISALIDFVLHIDKYIAFIVENYGVLAYLLLFMIILLETGLVITPFLPGDSLLFVAGALAGAGFMNIFLLFFLLALAAIIGDSLNYFLGNYLGKNIFQGNKYIKKEYLDKTRDFYKKHGGKTIIMARFIPIIRTFAPFVAGVGKMRYSRFFSFNVIGGIAWVALFLFAGYYFGAIPIIAQNLNVVILIIIATSLIPLIIEYLKNRGN